MTRRMTRLEQLRTDAFLSVADLAEATGVPARTISYLERALITGIRPRPATIAPLAKHFDVPASSLLHPALAEDLT